MRRRLNAKYRLLFLGMISLWMGLMSGGCVSGTDGGAAKADREGASKQKGLSVAQLLPISSAHQDARAMTANELVRLSGNPCDSPLVESRCMNDEDDIEFVADCDARGYHAVVSNHAGALLLNGVPPRDDQRIGLLSYGQVVCVQAIARIGAYPSYLFITADAGKTPSSQKCEQVAPGRFKGGCAIGWVDRDDMQLIDNTK